MLESWNRLELDLLKPETDLGDAVDVDSSDDDRRISANAETEAFVFTLAKANNTRSGPVVLGREDGDGAEPVEQVLNFVLTKVRECKRELEVSLRYDGWRVEHLLLKKRCKIIFRNF